MRIRLSSASTEVGVEVGAELGNLLFCEIWTEILAKCWKAVILKVGVFCFVFCSKKMTLQDPSGGIISAHEH